MKYKKVIRAFLLTEFCGLGYGIADKVGKGGFVSIGMEDGRPKTGDGRPKTEDRRRKTEDGSPKTEDGRRK